jgi:hypothetical protein
MARGNRKRPARGQDARPWVWEASPTGWKRVRARVPSPSERVPRPPSPAGYAESAVGAGPLDPVDPDTFKRGLRELGQLGEALARAMLAPIELIRELERKIGGAPTAALVGYVIVKHMGTKKGKAHARYRRSRSD